MTSTPVHTWTQSNLRIASMAFPGTRCDGRHYDLEPLGWMDIGIYRKVLFYLLKCPKIQNNKRTEWQEEAQ